jgi:DNA (cytosine-5)-methyltransferase 1
MRKGGSREMWLNVPQNPAPPSDFRIAGFFSGSGMFERAVALAAESLGFRPACCMHCEWEAVAAAALVGLEASSGGETLIWDDLRTFDAEPWRGKIHCLCAGVPCPSFSSAGKRLGNEDERAFGENFDPLDRTTWGPQPHLLRVIDLMRPALVILENVPEWVTSGAFRRFGDELSNLGYEIEDPLFLAAEDVRAPHERERVFILAHASGSNWKSWPQWQRVRETTCELAVGASGGFGIGGESSRGDGFIDRGEPELADADERRRRTQGNCGISSGKPDRRGEQLGNAKCIRKRQSQRDDAAKSRNNAGRNDGRSGIELGDSASIRSTQLRAKNAGRIGSGMQESGERNYSIPLFPPGRGDNEHPHHPDFAAWAAIAEMDPTLMPRIEPELSVVVDGMAFSAADLLRIGGNGVVPLVAAIATRVLLLRALHRVE